MLRKFFAQTVGTVFAASPDDIDQAILRLIREKKIPYSGGLKSSSDDTRCGENDYNGKDGFAFVRFDYRKIFGLNLTLGRISCTSEMVDDLKAALRPYKLSSAVVASGRDVLSNMGSRAGGWTPQQNSIEIPEEDLAEEAAPAPGSS